MVLHSRYRSVVGVTAALIHQALVYQGKISPLPNNAAAATYIVGR